MVFAYHLAHISDEIVPVGSNINSMHMPQWLSMAAILPRAFSFTDSTNRVPLPATITFLSFDITLQKRFFFSIVAQERVLYLP